MCVSGSCGVMFFIPPDVFFRLLFFDPGEHQAVQGDDQSYLFIEILHGGKIWWETINCMRNHERHLLSLRMYIRLCHAK